MKLNYFEKKYYKNHSSVEHSLKKENEMFRDL
jgi:hypothetical protein